jgi:hypothetical protein
MGSIEAAAVRVKFSFVKFERTDAGSGEQRI